MEDRIRGTLTQLAISNPGVKGRFKLAACLSYRGKIVTTGVNSYKTHPIMMNRSYRDEQIHLHAEADAINRALRLHSDLSHFTLSVVRVKRSKDGLWTYGTAKPCAGCLSLVSYYNINKVEYT